MTMPSPAPAGASPSVQQLRTAVEDMDCQAQSALSEISALCRLALTALETPHGWDQADAIASTLTTIWGKADDAQSRITIAAEGVGCEYQDPAWLRRLTARARQRPLQPEVAA